MIPFIFHVFFAFTGGAIPGYVYSTYGDWFPEPVVIEMPVVRTPQAEGSENNVQVAPGGNAQAGELE